MNIMLTMRQVRRVFWDWEESGRGCEVCDLPLPPGESICEAAACQMQALEAQAMLAPCTVGPSATRRQTVLRFAAALPAGTGWGNHPARSAWAFELSRLKLFSH